MSHATPQHIAESRSYESLVNVFPPRMIRDEESLAANHRVIEGLMAIETPTPDQLEFLELLSTLVENYESASFPTPSSTLGELLTHLIEAKGVSDSDVCSATNIDAATMTNVLAGKDAFVIEQLAQLSRYFNVAPLVLLEAAQRTAEVSIRRSTQ